MPQKTPILLIALIFFTLTGLYLFYPGPDPQEAQVPSERYGTEWPQKSSPDESARIRYNTPNGPDRDEEIAAQVPVQNNPHIHLIYTYRDLEAELCGSAVEWINKTLGKDVKGPCPKRGIVTVGSGGRTGNQMWEYASVWAVARRTGLEPYVPNCIRLKLDQIFEHLTVPHFGEIANCPIQFNTFVQTIREWTSDQKQNIVMPRFYAEPSLVSPQLNAIRKEFTFTKELRDQAQAVLKEILKKVTPMEYTLVSVHVRRTDYIIYLKKVYSQETAKPQFFTNAMNYYRSKYPNCLFIYVSDDPAWCTEEFGKLKDVVVTSNHSPAVDLAVMAACNHSIFDYGTYGEWGAILAGGEMVTQNFRKSRDMKQWIHLNQKPPS